MIVISGKVKILFFLFFFSLVPVFVFGVLSLFGWPLKEDVVSRITLRPGGSWTADDGTYYAGHLGEDIAVATGTPVYSAGSGEVVVVKRWPVCNVYETINGVAKLKERTHGWAGVVIIKHTSQSGLAFNVSNASISEADSAPEVVYTQYGHLDNILVNEGDIIDLGTKIAEVGDVCDWGDHLHFEIFDENGFERDQKNSSGAGFGYSGVHGSAPHRYTPSIFVNQNKFVAVPEEIIPTPTLVEEIKQTEQTQKISLMRTTWDRLSTFMIQSLKRVLSAVPSPEQQEEVVSTNVDVSETQAEEVEAPVERVYGARFVRTEIPVSFVAGAKQVTVSVEVENTGTAVWEKNTVSFNVVGGRTSNAMWYHPSWVTQLRPIIVSQRLESGQKAVVSFTVTVPEIDRRLRLQLVRPEGGTYVQVGTALTTIVLSEVVVPPPKPPTQPTVSPVSQTPDENISSNTQTGTTTIVTPFVDTTSLFVRTGGGGRRSNEEENEEVETLTTTPTSTDSTPTSTDPTPTSTEPVVTSTDPLPELSDLGITTPVDPLEVVYTNESEYIFAGTSDEYTDTVVVTKDDVVIATTTPSGGVWEIPITLVTGTQSLVLYGTASEERQTNSTTIIVVYDAEAPFVDIQLLSVGEGSIVVDLITFDDSPVSSYTVEFFDVVEFFSEPTECVEGLFVFEAPALQYYVEGGELYVEIIGTNYVCGFIVDTQTVEEPVVSAPYNEDYSISVRAKGIDVAGNESSWWYSAVPLAVRDLGDVGGEL